MFKWLSRPPKIKFKSIKTTNDEKIPKLFSRELEFEENLLQIVQNVFMLIWEYFDQKIFSKMIIFMSCLGFKKL